MSFRIFYRDVRIECDTPEEAILVAKQLRSGAEDVGMEMSSVTNDILFANQASSQSSNSRWTESRLKEFLSLVEGPQRRIVDSLIDNPDGRTDKQLLQLLGWASGKMLGGALSGLAKNARKAGIGVNELYSRNSVNIGGQALKEYKLTDSFQSAVQKYGSN